MTVGLSAANIVTGWLNTIKGTTYTSPTATWVELHTADPGAAGTTAVAAGSTTRLQITTGNWTSSSGGSALAMAASIGPWTNAGTTETLTHISVFGASSAGTFWFSITLTTPQPWAIGQTFNLTSCSISVAPQAA